MRYAVTFALVAGLLSGGVSFVAGQRSATVAAERDAHKAAAERLNASLIELHATTEAAMAAAAEERGRIVVALETQSMERAREARLITALETAMDVEREDDPTLDACLSMPVPDDLLRLLRADPGDAGGVGPDTGVSAP